MGATVSPGHDSDKGAVSNGGQWATGISLASVTAGIGSANVAVGGERVTTVSVPFLRSPSLSQYSLDGDILNVGGQALLAVDNVDLSVLQEFGRDSTGGQATPSGSVDGGSSSRILDVQGDHLGTGNGQEVSDNLNDSGVQVSISSHVVTLDNVEACHWELLSAQNAQVAESDGNGRVILGSISLEAVGSGTSETARDDETSAVVAEASPAHGHNEGELTLNGVLSSDNTATIAADGGEPLLIVDAVLAGPGQQAAHCWKRGWIRYSTGTLVGHCSALTGGGRSQSEDAQQTNKGLHDSNNGTTTAGPGYGG